MNVAELPLTVELWKSIMSVRLLETEP